MEAASDRWGAVRRIAEEFFMTASIAQAPTALDEAIIRNAESTLETVGRAREAIHSVIFGQEQVVDLTLVKGNYLVVCFINDRAGGPPHFVPEAGGGHGMAKELTVE